MRLTVDCFSVQSRKFPSYTDMEEFVLSPDVESLFFGENASAFISFWALDGFQPFGKQSFRIGLICNHERSPHLFVSPDGQRIVLGINEEVIVVELTDPLVARTVSLDSWLHAFLWKDGKLAAIHELGATVLTFPQFEVSGRLYCEVVSDARLLKDELVLFSADGESKRLNLA